MGGLPSFPKGFYYGRYGEVLWIGAMDKPDPAQLGTLDTLPSNGVIKRFSNKKGYGFITGRDGVDRFFHFADAAPGFTPKTGAFVLFDPQDHQKGPRAVNVRLDPASLVEVDRANGKISALQSQHIKRDGASIGSPFWRVVLCSVVLFWLARENQNEFILGIGVILWIGFVADFLIKLVRAFCRSIVTLAWRLLGVEKSTQPTRPAEQWTHADEKDIRSQKVRFAGGDEDLVFFAEKTDNEIDLLTDPVYRFIPGNIHHHSVFDD